MTPERVTVQVGFMSPAECVRRIKAASQKEAEAMLHTLEDEARRVALRERDAEWRKAARHDKEKSTGGWLWCGNCDNPMDPEGGEPCCACEWSAPLRALLEEAGSNG